MSIESWKAEFYQVEASTINNDKDAIQHAIRKFTGALPKNLKKHNLEKQWNKLVGGGQAFTFDGYSCALCALHCACEGCPLMQVTNSCDDGNSIFMNFLKTDKPKAMLLALRQSKKYVQEKQE